MRKILSKPILFFVIAVAVLYVIIYLVPRVSGVLQSSYTVQYGELTTYDDCEGYFVRNEKVYFAKKGGEENRLVKEGKLVRKGTTVIKLTGSSDAKEKREFKNIREGVGKSGIKTEDFVTEEEGIVVYAADGYESKVTPKNLAKKKKDFFEELDNKDLTELARDKVSKGDPVFKVADRSGWYIACYVPKESADRYVAGEGVRIVIDPDKDGNGTEINGKISSVRKEGDERKLILKTDYYYEGFARTRVSDLRVITSSAMGLIIENESISKKNGNEGVYVKQKTGDYKFTRINVISTDGERSVISKSYFYDDKGEIVNTVRNYDEILRR